MKIPLLVVLSFKINSPDDVISILDSIDPPHVPYFSGEARVVVGKDVKDTINFLERDE